jgi:hypothetical protein
VELKDFQIIHSNSYKGTCGAERPSDLHSNLWIVLQGRLKEEKKPSLNSTCGGERLSDYPQQVLQGNL